MGLFFTDKKYLLGKRLPRDFPDLFPIMAAHAESSSFFLRDGRSAGSLYRLGQMGAEDMERLGAILSTWLRSGVSGPVLSVTVSLHRRESATGHGETMMGLVVALPPLGLSHGFMAKTKAILGIGSEEFASGLIETVEHLIRVRQSLADTMMASRIPVSQVVDPSDMLSAARYFWTYAAAPIDPASIGTDPLPGFSVGHELVPTRTFWREPGQIRCLASMRGPADVSPGKDIVATTMGMAPCGLDGTAIFVLSSGGPEKIPLGRAIQGSMLGALVASEADISARIRSNISGDVVTDDNEEDTGFEANKREEASLTGKIQDRARKMATYRMSTETKTTIRFTALFCATMALDSSVGKSLFGRGERRAVLDFERSLLSRLVVSASGSQWALVDTQWMEALFGIIPGASRLDHAGALAAFDTIYAVVSEVAPETDLDADTVHAGSTGSKR